MRTNPFVIPCGLCPQPEKKKDPRNGKSSFVANSSCILRIVLASLPTVRLIKSKHDHYAFCLCLGQQSRFKTILARVCLWVCVDKQTTLWSAVITNLVALKLQDPI